LITGGVMGNKPAIFLINPPFEEGASVGSSRSMRHVLNVIPPLGLAYCAAALEKAGISVELFDCAVERRDLCARLREAKPLIIGISATTPVFESAKALACRIRALLPGVRIILGGAHVTADPQAAMQSGCFDFGVVGEGEETIVELAGHILRGQPAAGKIAGIVFMAGPQPVATGARGFIVDLDTLPYPARHLLPPLERYRPTPASFRRLPLGILITSRGCPHRCTFCDRSVFGNNYRFRSAENVLGEVEELTGRYGARELRFFDDCFALDKERVAAICAGLRKRRKKIGWSCLTTVASVNKELLREMRSSGCWQVLFGLESGDQRMLELLKKGASLQQNCQAVRWAKEAGLSVRADFIVGTPGETEESLARTLDFAVSSGVDYAHFNKFVPYPGTELHAALRSRGHHFDFSRGSSITAHSEFIYIPETIKAPKAYKQFVNAAHRKFYLRPSYIAKRLFSIRSWEELAGQARGCAAISFLRTEL
jgi:anaerobic magnesium-protoporphyrin IX monomethyl ester cyclase